MKTVYRVEQAIWGADKTSEIWFATKEEQQKYLSEHDYCNAIPSKRISDKTYEQWQQQEKENEMYEY